MAEATERNEVLEIIGDPVDGRIETQYASDEIIVLCGARTPDITRAVVKRFNAHDALVAVLTAIADQAERASLVQDRSVHIIKQVCALMAKDARAALKLAEGKED